MRTRSGRLDSRRPFRRAEALAAGLTVRELTGPRFQKVFHGVYVAAGVRLTDLERARAALMIFPTAFASHATAARIWGAVLPDDQQVHISVAPDKVRSRRRGISAHQTCDESDLVAHRGIRVSTPARCFCELATDGVGLVALVVADDSLVKSGAVTPPELIAAADNWPGRRAAVASRAARLVREEVDSPMESRLRMLIVLSGLPEPTVNFVIRHQNGVWRLRFDLCYRDLRLIIEYDGDHHAVDPRQRSRDLERREEIGNMGYRIVVIQKHQFYEQPDQVLQRIAEPASIVAPPRTAAGSGALGATTSSVASPIDNIAAAVTKRTRNRAESVRIAPGVTKRTRNRSEAVRIAPRGAKRARGRSRNRRDAAPAARLSGGRCRAVRPRASSACRSRSRGSWPGRAARRSHRSRWRP